MYNSRAVAVLLVSLVVGCPSFESGSGSSATDGGAPDDGSPDEGRRDGALPDAAPRDAGNDAGAERAPIIGAACGTVTCPLDRGCCLTSQSPVCTERVGCAGFHIACSVASDCGGGGVCCFDGASSHCAAVCAVTQRASCAVASDCAPVACGPVMCAGVDPLKLCDGPTPQVVVRSGLTCTVP